MSLEKTGVWITAAYSIIAVIILLLTLTFGAYCIQESFTHDCNTMGMFRYNDVVYKCEVLANTPLKRTRNERLCMSWP